MAMDRASHNHPAQDTRIINGMNSEIKADTSTHTCVSLHISNERKKKQNKKKQVSNKNAATHFYTSVYYN